jgi:hypothetical protein
MMANPLQGECPAIADDEPGVTTGRSDIQTGGKVRQDDVWPDLGQQSSPGADHRTAELRIGKTGAFEYVCQRAWLSRNPGRMVKEDRRLDDAKSVAVLLEERRQRPLTCGTCRAATMICQPSAR